MNKTPIRLKFSSAASVPPDAEVLLVKCGHAIAFELLAKDPHRDTRRAKALARDCPSCRQARAEAEVKAAAERKAQRKAVPARPSYVRGFKPRGRLPDGARFAAVYDATSTRWSGALTIGEATFQCDASSVRKLLSKLDDAYRASLPEAAAGAA